MSRPSVERARPGRPGSVSAVQDAPTMIASGLKRSTARAHAVLKISAVSLPRSRAWKVV